MFTMESSKGNSFFQMQKILTYESHNFPCLCFYNNHSLFIWGIVGFWKCEHSPEGLWLCRMVVTFMKDCVFSKGLWPFYRLHLFQNVLLFWKVVFFLKSCDLWNEFSPSSAYIFYKIKSIDHVRVCDPMLSFYVR